MLLLFLSFLQGSSPLHVTGTLHPPVDNNYFKNVNANHIPPALALHLL
jgi:hypothetical protein